MADAGHSAVDELLRRTEREVMEIYDRAAKEAQTKTDAYFRRFAERDKKKLALKNAGKISEKEYLEWRKNQMLTGQRWADLTNVLTEDLTNADKIAMSVVNGHIPEAYAINMNYGTYQIEHELGIDTGFTLYDRPTVERLIREKPELFPHVDLPEDKRWNMQHIRNELTQSVLQGEPVQTLSKRIFPEILRHVDLRGKTKKEQKSLIKKAKNSAMRAARTAMTGAQNAGRVDAYQRAKDMGIAVKQEWVSAHDGHTRESHLDVDGEQVEIGHKFSNDCAYPGDPGGPPAEVYNCFAGGTKIASDSEIVRSYCHEYSGQLIEIKTAGGVCFTCTPNHPILSNSGWICAERLNKGDNILVASVKDNGVTRSYPDVNHIFPRMDAFHKFFHKLRGQRTCSLSVNFHGDIPTAEVEIVTQKRFLRIDGNTSGKKNVHEFLLKLSNKAFLSKSAFFKHNWSICFSALCYICSGCESLSLLWRSLLHSDKHGFGTIPDVNISVSESAINDLSANAKCVSEFVDGFSGEVSTDNIISVNRVVSERCHVYNLQTINGYYFVNSSISQNGEKVNGKFAIAHNCRCTLIPVLEGFESRTGRDFELAEYKEDKAAHKMSFEEWKEARGQDDRI